MIQSKEVQLQIDPSDVYVVPAQNVQPVMNYQQNQNGILQIDFLPAGCGVEGWACCMCLWCLPQPQPEDSHKFMIEIDGAEMGKLRQGQSSTWSLSPGTHMLALNQTGIGGFFRGMIAGDKSVYSRHISVLPGQTVRYELGFLVPKCGGSKNRYTLFCREAAIS